MPLIASLIISQVLVDGIFAGAAFPFPVIYSGGINPVLWRPIVGLHSLNIPPLSFDLTPFVGVMDDGLPHSIVVRTACKCSPRRPPASHARAHHGAVLSFSPQVRIAPAPGSQASGTWYVDPPDCMLIASLIPSGTW